MASRVLFDGEPLPHFNEVDECAGLDGLMTYRVHRRWASRWKTPCTTCAGAISIVQARSSDYVWVFLISGSVPPAHLEVAGRRHQRAAAEDVFPHGRRDDEGGSRPGEIVWSRMYVARPIEDGLGASRGR